MEKNNSKNCPFCSYLKNGEFISESELAFSISDKFPVNKGHTLVMPKRHCDDYFSLTEEEQHACWQMVNQIKDKLDQAYHPDGYNVGINNAAAAGQTVPHVHIHVIPRYSGDVENPLGGIRGVIPGKKEY